MLFTTRILRLFAYGFLSVILVLYLRQVGLSETQAGLLLIRYSVSQMDMPTRQSYTMAVVEPDERSAAAGITGIARTTGAALAPVFTGVFLSNPVLIGTPFVVAGVLKIVYDVLLYRNFHGIKPPEEIST